MATNAERIALVVELATDDAKDKLGKKLAAFISELAKNNGLSQSGRWTGLAARLADSARAFTDDLAVSVRAIDQGSEALAAYSNAVEAFLSHLDSVFADEWGKDAPWRRISDAPAPPHWQEMRDKLSLALKVQKAEFDRPPADPARKIKHERGPDWKRYDQSVNLVAWLLTSPKAPTDYASEGANNLARLVNEEKVRCRAGSLANVTDGNAVFVEASSSKGQAQLRLVTACLADAITQGSNAPLPHDKTFGIDLLTAIRASPNSYPPRFLEALRQADKSVKGVGKADVIARAAIKFSHALDKFDDMHGTTEGRPWRMAKCNRATSSFAFAFDDGRTIIDALGLQFSYADLWAVLGEAPDAKADMPHPNMAKTSERKSRTGRRSGTGYQRADAPILALMRNAIDADASLNATSAARKFADQAVGASFDAKVDRLARAYRAGGNRE